MYAQNCVANVCTPVGTRIRVAVSSVTADRNTRLNAAARPGPTSGSVTRQSTSIGPRPSDRPTSSRPVGGARRGVDRDEGKGEEEDRVGDDQQRRGLVEAPAQRCTKKTSASAITRPGSACTM